MATYTVNLTPSSRNQVSEGHLDTSVVGGYSIQRTEEALLVVNGSDRKLLYRLADGASYDDTTFAVAVHDIPAGHPTFNSGMPVVEGDNVSVGHPTARSDSGSTL